jgi:hypothetical protein
MTDADDFLLKTVDWMAAQHRPPAGEYSAPTKLLLADLEASRTAANGALVDAIVGRAKTEQYHDFLSDSATPILDLVFALKRAGLNELVAEAKRGKYDAKAVGAAQRQ